MKFHLFTKSQYQWAALVILIHGIAWFFLSIAFWTNLSDTYLFPLFTTAIIGQFIVIPIFQFTYISTQKVSLIKVWKESIVLIITACYAFPTLFCLTLPLVMVHPTAGSLIYGTTCLALGIHILNYTRRKAPI